MACDSYRPALGGLEKKQHVDNEHHQTVCVSMCVLKYECNAGKSLFCVNMQGEHVKLWHQRKFHIDVDCIEFTRKNIL